MVNPTVELVGTVVSDPQVVTTPRFLGLRLELETRLDYPDLYGAMASHLDRHDVGVRGEAARALERARAGDRVHIRGVAWYETHWDGNRARVQPHVDGLQGAFADGTEADRNEVYIIARYHSVRMILERSPAEALRFRILPMTFNELGLEDRSAPGALLDAYAFGDLAREIEGLPDETALSLRGRMASFDRRPDVVPPRGFELFAERWG